MKGYTDLPWVDRTIKSALARDSPQDLTGWEKSLLSTSAYTTALTRTSPWVVGGEEARSGAHVMVELKLASTGRCTGRAGHLVVGRVEVVRRALY
jgi:hypothetical protein